MVRQIGLGVLRYGINGTFSLELGGGGECAGEVALGQRRQTPYSTCPGSAQPALGPSSISSWSQGVERLSEEWFGRR